MLARMRASEITEWMAYERVTGPLGPERADLLTSIIAATIANTASERRLRPDEFMPDWDRGRAQTWQQQLAIAQTLNRSLGGTTQEA